MARSGVTYVDISRAAESFRERGIEPTVDRVREYLKTGSKSTIAPLLKRWKANLGDVEFVPGLPSDIVEAVKSLYDRVNDAANNRINGIKEEYEYKLSDSEKTRADLELRLTSEIGEKQVISNKLVELESALSTSMNTVTIQADEIKKLTFELQACAEKIKDQKSVVADLKSENAGNRDRFEHFQRCAAEDRQTEREQFSISQQTLQNHLIYATKQLEESKHHIARQENKFAESQAKVTETALQLEKQNHKIQILGNERADLTEKLSQANDHIQDINHQVESLVEKVENISLQLTEANQSAQSHKEKLKTALKTVKLLEDKNLILADNNLSLMQEKAMLQGQLKQIERSLVKRDV
jgi:chromosome segregation ATPase